MVVIGLMFECGCGFGMVLVLLMCHLVMASIMFGYSGMVISVILSCFYCFVLRVMLLGVYEVVLFV